MHPRDRIPTLQATLRAHDIWGAVLWYSRDIFYYTGTAQPAYLIVLPNTYRLWVRHGLDFARQEVFIETTYVQEERRLEAIYTAMFTPPPAAHPTLATELDMLPTQQFTSLQRVFADYTFVDVSPLVLAQRKTKDAWELTQIQAACTAIDRGHRAVVATLRDGITELELAAVVEHAHRVAGHEGIFFMRQPDFFMSRGPLASGPNLLKVSGVVYTLTGVGLSPAVPAGPSRRRIGRGDLVIVDMPTLVNGYHADQTRTYSVGPASAHVHGLYDRLRTIADRLIERIAPGMTGRDIYLMALAHANALGVSETFLQLGHGHTCRLIGHSIGLELNEPPLLAASAQDAVVEGCVLAVELHLQDARFGAMKLEDMLFVGPHGNDLLTQSPRHLWEL